MKLQKSVILSVFAVAAWVSAETARPNILFIAVDDLRPELGCYGREYIVSPNIDRLANEGVMFSRAFCNMPVCGASRASLMTGLRPSATRFTYYGSRADEDAAGVIDLAGLFKQAGYRTVSNGKVYHHRTDNADSWDELYRPKEIAQYFTERNLAILKNATSQNGFSRKGYPYEASNEPDDAYQGGRVANKAIEELKRAKEASEPAFITAGFTKPHLPFNCPQKYWDLYPEETIAFPSNYFVPTNAPAESLHDFGELRGYYGIPKEGRVPDLVALNLIRGYRACVSFTDAMIGRIFQTMDELEMWDNTIVVLWGDHGWQLAEHALWCKHANFNTSLQTPLIVRAPGKANKNSSALVEFVDLYPTLCELAGIKPPAHLEGTSFVPVLDQPSTDWKEAVFARYKTGDSIRTSRYLYTEWKNEAGETVAHMLYDHKVDPDENVNISGNPENAALVRKLSKRLDGGAGWKQCKPDAKK